jgi:hypothetical protein
MSFRRLVAIFLASFLAGSIVFTNGSIAGAEDSKVTSSFTGFAFEKSDVTLNMKKEIKQWLQANPGYIVASCVGFTGHNVNKRTQAFLTTLANERAKNICDYIHRSTKTITIHSTKGVPGNGQTANARKVQVSLYKSADSGGSGIVTIGVCDSSLTVSMKSRISSGAFAFDTITVKDISSSCQNDVLDIYFLDSSGNQIASSLNNIVTKTAMTLTYKVFTPREIPSNQIAQVAFEFRVN